MLPEKLKVRPVTEIYGFSNRRANAGGGCFWVAPKKAPPAASAEVESFYEKLITLYESSGLSLLFNFRETSFDLYAFYKEVIQRGGLHEVTAKEKWGEIASIINSKCNIKLSTNQLQRLYGMILYQFEQMYHYRLPSPRVPKSPGHPSDKEDGTGCSAGKRKEYVNSHSPVDLRTFKRKCDSKTKQLSKEMQNKSDSSHLSSVLCGSKDDAAFRKKSDENNKEVSNGKQKEDGDSLLSVVHCGTQVNEASKGKCDDSSKEPSSGKQKECENPNLSVTHCGTQDDPTAQRKVENNSEQLITGPEQETQEVVKQTAKTNSDDTLEQPSTGKQDGCDSSQMSEVLRGTKDDDASSKQMSSDNPSQKTTGSMSEEEKASMQTSNEGKAGPESAEGEPKEANPVAKILAEDTPKQAKSVPRPEDTPKQAKSVPRPEEQKQSEQTLKQANPLSHSEEEKQAVISPKEAKTAPKGEKEKPVMQTPTKGKAAKKTREKKPYVRTPKKDKDIITREKDPNAPTKPRTGYQIFLSYECNRLKMIHGDKPGSHIRDMAIQAWKSLSLEDRKPYLEEHRRDKDRFEREMIMYKEQKTMLCFQQENHHPRQVLENHHHPRQVLSNYHPVEPPPPPPVFVQQNPRPAVSNYTMPVSYPTVDGDYHVTLQPSDLDKYSSIPDEDALEVAIGMLKNARAQNEMLFQMDWDGYSGSLDLSE